MKNLVFTICLLGSASGALATEVCGIIKSIENVEGGNIRLEFSDQSKLEVDMELIFTSIVSGALVNGTNICISTEPYQHRLLVNKIRRP